MDLDKEIESRGRENERKRGGREEKEEKEGKNREEGKRIIINITIN